MRGWLALADPWHNTNNLLANTKLSTGKKDLEFQGYHLHAGTYSGTLGESCLFFRIYCLCNWVQVPVKARRGCLVLWSCSNRWMWAIQHRCSETNPGPRQEQYTLLITEPSLWPQVVNSQEDKKGYIKYFFLRYVVKKCWALCCP